MSQQHKKSCYWNRTQTTSEVSKTSEVFYPTTTIKYYLPKDNFVNLSIYNVKGQKIKKLVNEIKSKGNNSVVWNGKDDSNNSVSSGVYFYRIKTDNVSTTQKILLLK